MVRGTVRFATYLRSAGIAVAALCAAGVVTTAAQQPRAPFPPSWEEEQPASDGAVTVLPVQGRVWLFVVDGSNITAQVGDDGVLLVDAGTGANSERVIAAIRRLTDRPIRWLINTHVHGDHTGGNEALFRAGSATPQNRIGTGLTSPASLPSGATIGAHESVLVRMSAPTGERAGVPQPAWPTLTYFGAGREMRFNDEPIQVLHQPAAHTDGDSIVIFRHSEVVSAGDVFNMTGYPVIDLEKGGTIGGVIAALNTILDHLFPGEKQEGGTYVIPGHGRLADEADVVSYRNMVTVIRDRVVDLKGKGLTLEQVKAAKPSADYDRRWANAAWTADMFVEAVYRTLPQVPVTSRR